MKKINKKTLIQLMQIFIFGGIFGFIYEEIFYLIDLGKIVKRGITYGPWIPIYAFGAVMITIICYKLRDKPLLIFTAGTAISGIIEYVTGYILFNYFHLRLWDYNTEILNFGNINGYICLRSVAFFGVSALFLIYFILPILDKITIKDNKIVNISTFIFFIVFIFDIIISSIL